MEDIFALLVASRSNDVKAVPNIRYSESRKSVYYRNALAVYQSDREQHSNHIRTALYWDDHPNTALVNGHLACFIHKIGPPGHWFHITMQGARAGNLDEAQCAELFTMVSVALYEGFVSCRAKKSVATFCVP